MLLIGAPMWVGMRKASAMAQKNNIPPETAREMVELEKFLFDSPSDPAGLFSLAMDYATIGDKSRAIKLLMDDFVRIGHWQRAQ